jgi:hypothetical protein
MYCFCLLHRCLSHPSSSCSGLSGVERTKQCVHNEGTWRNEGPRGRDSVYALELNWLDRLLLSVVAINLASLVAPWRIMMGGTVC